MYIAAQKELIHRATKNQEVYECPKNNSSYSSLTVGLEQRHSFTWLFLVSPALGRNGKQKKVDNYVTTLKSCQNKIMPKLACFNISL